MGAEIKDDRYPWVGENHVVFSEANRNVSVLQWLFLTAKITERRHKGCKAGGASTTLRLTICKEIFADICVICGKLVGNFLPQIKGDGRRN